MPVTLGITTAGAVEAAVEEGGNTFVGSGSEQALDSLLVRVKEALSAAGRGIADVDLLAVCTGPGSFTGLRIGVAFAKTLAQARSLPLVGVSSYDVVELQAGEMRVAIVSGKKDYYYARVVLPGGDPIFARGSMVELATALAPHLSAGGIAPFIAPLPPGDAARRVATLGRARASHGAETDWRALAIDYGQRPNAVVNWETRRVARERSRPSRGANPSRE